METLVVAQQHQHRNQYYSRSETQGTVRFGSPPSRGFRGINCRTFQSEPGLLPTPFKPCTTNPVIEPSFLCSFLPKTPSPPVYSHSDDNNIIINNNNIYNSDKQSKKLAKRTSAMQIPFNIKVDVFNEEGFIGHDFSYSELWAGPAYSNSPPPSSLPIPKFSLRPKRTVSLDLPTLASDFDLHHTAKSAPPSPTRERNMLKKDFFKSDDDATKNLRRILNLNITDE